MSVRIPVKDEDFVKTGKRFSSEDVIGEIDRLIAVGKEDLGVLTPLGYNTVLLGELEGHRATLCAKTADLRQLRGAKKGALASEQVAVTDGKCVLSSGVAMALVAVSRRPVPAGEQPEVTAEILKGLDGRISSLSGGVNRTSAVLRTRLSTLKSILELPELAPAKADKANRDEFITKIDGALAKLEELAEAKKTLQENAKAATSTLHELGGRAYYNLRLLCRVGHAAFKASGNPTRAASYKLCNLNRRIKNGKPGVPAQAPPAPGSGPASPGLQPVPTNQTQPANTAPIQ